VSPIAWVNDDMPELGAGTTLDTILDDARRIGFDGVELGGIFPRDPELLAPILSARKLDLVGGWYSCELLTRSAEQEIAAMAEHLALLEYFECPVFVIAETSNAIHGQKGTPLAQSPSLGAGDWQEYGARMNAVADHVAGRGVRLAYHHHLGTIIENQDDLDRFLAVTSINVGLTLDTGHAALGGIDALGCIAAHPERIAHVHCKDVRRAVFDAVMQRGASFLDGVLEGIYTAPGDGDLDFGAVMRALAGIGYRGWIVVEAEQDPALADPATYSTLGLETLKREAAAAELVAS
jgi:inosose dehydratase